ncbi:unnamed protein product [Oncorhynchus mykiss]|uniref:Photoreceptor cadherin n=1 Tax=Oncorhynchus mykiss TaxID=8022 RepID=A0A060XUS9_ONCMY|nr:unnamed protein product [Oncorhynchus mykiss]
MAEDIPVEDYPTEIEEQLTGFESSVGAVNNMVQTILSMPRNELVKKLDPLEQAKLDLMSAYSLNSLFWMYLVTQGINPKEHAIKQELVRYYIFTLKRIPLLPILFCSANWQTSDYAPYFYDKGPSSTDGNMALFSISEDTPVGTQVYILNGTDPEGDAVWFGLTFEKGTREYLRVDPKSGNITLIQELDREKQGEISALVSITDGRNKVVETIRVFVTDANDEEPEFQNLPFAVDVPEDTPAGSSIYRVQAVDKDMGSGGSVTYYLQGTPTTKFTIDGHSGVLRIKPGETLDFETTTLHFVTVVAKVRWPLAIPFFYTAVVTKFFTDTQPKTPNNNVSSQSILSSESWGKEAFLLFLFSESWGREAFLLFLFSESWGREAFLLFLFSENKYLDPHICPIILLSIPGMSIIKIIVVKQRSDILVSAMNVGANAKFKLRLVGPGRVLRVVPQTVLNEAQVTVIVEDSAAIDYEKGKSLTYKLLAVEIDTPERFSATADIVIHLLDTNDNTPRFTSEYYIARIPENSPGGSNVVSVTVSTSGLFNSTQTSLPPKYDYHSINILTSILSVPFQHSINILTSILSMFCSNILTSTLSFMFCSNILTSILSSMFCSNILTSIVSYMFCSNILTSILSFMFCSNILTSILSSMFCSNILTSIVSSMFCFNILTSIANDPDSGLWGEVKYSIYGSGSDLFLIHPSSGIIYTQAWATLDAEVKSKYNFYVKAEDTEGKYSLAEVFVTVLDMNDHVPEFDDSFVERTMIIGAPVRVEAIDADAESPNNVIEYSIMQAEPDNIFDINAETGEIKLKSYIKSMEIVQNITKQKDCRWSLVVQARDRGSPSFSTTAVVNIDITEATQLKGPMAAFLLQSRHNPMKALGMVAGVISILVGVTVLISTAMFLRNTKSNRIMPARRIIIRRRPSRDRKPWTFNVPFRGGGGNDPLNKFVVGDPEAGSVSINPNKNIRPRCSRSKPNPLPPRAPCLPSERPRAAVPTVSGALASKGSRRSSQSRESNISSETTRIPVSSALVSELKRRLEQKIIESNSSYY